MNTHIREWSHQVGELQLYPRSVLRMNEALRSATSWVGHGWERNDIAQSVRANGKDAVERTKNRLALMRDRLRGALLCEKCPGCAGDFDQYYGSDDGQNGNVGARVDGDGMSYVEDDAETRQTPSARGDDGDGANAPDSWRQDRAKIVTASHLWELLSRRSGQNSAGRTTSTSLGTSPKHCTEPMLFERPAQSGGLIAAQAAAGMSSGATHVALGQGRQCVQVLGDRLVHWNQSHMLRVRTNGTHITGERDRVKRAAHAFQGNTLRRKRRNQARDCEPNGGTLIGGRALVKQGVEGLFSLMSWDAREGSRRGVGLSCLSGRVNLGNASSGYVDCLRMEFRCVLCLWFL
jgi:hypothetical protein